MLCRCRPYLSYLCLVAFSVQQSSTSVGKCRRCSTYRGEMALTPCSILRLLPLTLLYWPWAAYLGNQVVSAILQGNPRISKGGEYTIHAHGDLRPFALKVLGRSLCASLWGMLVMMMLVIRCSRLGCRGRIFGDLLVDARGRFFFGWVVRHFVVSADCFNHGVAWFIVFLQFFCEVLADWRFVCD